MTSIPEWQEIHEMTKADFLRRAREAAVSLLKTRDTITIDDVREIVAPPKGMNPNVMGAVFKGPLFEGTGIYVKSKRKISHHRPIQKFRLKL